MEHWEFLIQAEGSRLWQPIPAQASLPPRRYRLVARSTYPNITVRVQVTHRLETTPPKQRSVTRLRQTTPQGLMVIVPFTTFKPGQWEIACTPETESETWEKTLSLTVEKEPVAKTEAATHLSEESSQAAAPPPDPATAILSEVGEWESEADLPPEHADAIAQSIAELEKLLQQELTPLLEEPEAFWLNERVEAADDIQAPTPPPVSKLQLDLDADAFIATYGETIALTGQIQLSEQQPFPESITTAQLHYQLWHPQNQQLILDVSQPIELVTLPMTFRHSLIVPRQQGTCLLLGEVVLTATTVEQTMTLASQPFTITLNVTDIIDNLFAIPSSESDEQAVDVPPEPIVAEPEAPKPIVLDLPTVNNSTAPKLPTVQASDSTVIPPKINKVAANARKFLRLPNFPARTPIEAETNNSVQLPSASDSLEGEGQKTPCLEAGDSQATAAISPETAEPAQLAEVTEVLSEAEALETASFDETEVGEPPTFNDLALEQQEEQEVSKDQLETTPNQEDSEVVAEKFQSLKLQKRFWHRLSDLATDTEATQWLQAQSEDTTASSDSLEVTAGEAVPTREDREKTVTPDVEVAGENQEAAGTASSSDVSHADEVFLTVAEEIEAIEGQELPTEVQGEISAAEIDSFEEALREIAASDLPLPLAIEDSTMSEEIAATPVNSTDDPAAMLTAEAEATPPESLADSSVTTDWNSLEVVVDDEEAITPTPAVPRDTSGMPYPQGVMPPQRESPLVAKTTQPVPPPILIIPAGDLTAGETVILGVKIPPYEGSVFVKLWIQDRQHRTILDGPRTFVDFEFHADGERETLTQVTIPYGSMEIQFDAIAINPQTQQESHKAVVERTVVPEDLPSLSLREFDIDS